MNKKNENKKKNNCNTWEKQKPKIHIAEKTTKIKSAKFEIPGFLIQGVIT